MPTCKHRRPEKSGDAVIMAILEHLTIVWGKNKSKKKNMKYKVGDRVKVRSRAWWDKQPKDSDGDIIRGYTFLRKMADKCGSVLIIEYVDNDYYRVKENNYTWEDWMFEPSYTFAELDLPDWWDGRPVLGYVSDESEERAVERNILYWVWPNFFNTGFIFRAVKKDCADSELAEVWRYFAPAEQESRKVCITVKENGESKEIELTEAQIKQLGL